MTNDGVKAFYPEREQRAADVSAVKSSFRTNRSQHGASRTRLVAPSNCHNPDHRSAEVSHPGQSRQFGMDSPPNN